MLIKTAFVLMSALSLDAVAASSISALRAKLEKELPGPRTYVGKDSKNKECTLIVETDARSYRVYLNGLSAKREFILSADGFKVGDVYSFARREDRTSYVADPREEELRTSVAVESLKRVSYVETYGDFAELTYLLDIKEVTPKKWKVKIGSVKAGNMGSNVKGCDIEKPI